MPKPWEIRQKFGRKTCPCASVRSFFPDCWPKIRPDSPYCPTTKLWFLRIPPLHRIPQVSLPRTTRSGSEIDRPIFTKTVFPPFLLFFVASAGVPTPIPAFSAKWLFRDLLHAPAQRPSPRNAAATPSRQLCGLRRFEKLSPFYRVTSSAGTICAAPMAQAGVFDPLTSRSS